MMVPSKNNRGTMMFCKFCKRYDIPYLEQTQHLKKVHGLIDLKQNRNLSSIKEFVFLELVQ